MHRFSDYNVNRWTIIQTILIQREYFLKIVDTINSCSASHQVGFLVISFWSMTLHLSLHYQQPWQLKVGNWQSTATGKGTRTVCCFALLRRGRSLTEKMWLPCHNMDRQPGNMETGRTKCPLITCILSQRQQPPLTIKVSWTELNWTNN